MSARPAPDLLELSVTRALRLLGRGIRLRCPHCGKVELPYGKQLVDDVVNRTETAMGQEHCFMATQLALTAQKNARRIGPAAEKQGG